MTGSVLHIHHVRTRADLLDLAFSLSDVELGDRAESLGLPRDALTPWTFARLVEKIDDSAGPDGCWPWHGPRQGSGYGVEHVGGTTRGPHRLVQVLVGGPLVGGRRTQILHQCDTPRCCNPAHLHPGTAKENGAEKAARSRARTNVLTEQEREFIPALVLRQIQAADRRGYRLGRARAFEQVARIFGVSPTYVGALYDASRRVHAPVAAIDPEAVEAFSYAVATA